MTVINKCFIHSLTKLGVRYSNCNQFTKENKKADRSIGPNMYSHRHVRRVTFVHGTPKPSS